MKKLILTSIILSLTACHSNEIKGEDYISTDVGAVYHYESTGNGSTMPFTIKVDKCNSNKTSCEYTTTYITKDNTENISYQTKNTIKDGGVYYQDDMSLKERVSFPNIIILNKSIPYSYSNDFNDVKGSTTFTKVLPKISINNKVYENCLEEVDTSTAKIKANSGAVNNDGAPLTEVKLILKEISCKGIGLVKTEITQINNNSEPLITNTKLISISK